MYVYVYVCMSVCLYVCVCACVCGGGLKVAYLEHEGNSDHPLDYHSLLPVVFVVDSLVFQTGFNKTDGLLRLKKETFENR